MVHGGRTHVRRGVCADAGLGSRPNRGQSPTAGSGVWHYRGWGKFWEGNAPRALLLTRGVCISGQSPAGVASAGRSRRKNQAARIKSVRRAVLQLLHVADIRPVVKVSLVPTPNFQPQRSSSDRPLMPPGGGAGAYTQADKLPTSTGAMVPKQPAGPAAARGAPRRASPTQRRRPPGRYVARDLPARRALRRRAS